MTGGKKTAVKDRGPADFIALPYSPWSEKARWALDHHRVSYRESAYIPLLGEPGLRLKTKQWRGRVTVPVLIDEADVYTDSWDIARYAEAAGAGSCLFPAEKALEIETWNQRSETLLDCSRALATARVAGDPAALRESVPPSIPAPLRRLFGAVGVRYLTGKYRIRVDQAERCRETIDTELRAWRAALDGETTLWGTLTYADIAMACSLQLMAPVSDEYIQLGCNTRRGMTDPDVSADFADLAAIRDRIYDAWRGRPGEPG